MGLRGEYTQQEIHFMSVKNDTIIPMNFFDVIPSLAFSYQLGMTKTLRWGYNMRIQRPGIWFLNPYVNNSNPNNISYGNKDLDVEKTHNFNLNYGSFSQKLNYNATLSYSFTQNSITSYVFVDENGVTNNTFRNIGSDHSVGLEGFANWSPTSVIRMNVNSSVNYTDIQSTVDSSVRNNGFSGRAFGGVTFTLPQEFRLSVNGGVFSSRIQLQTTQRAFYFYSFSAMKSFFNMKLDVSINATSPFHKFCEVKSKTTGDGFTQKNNFKNPMRSFRLSLTYRFGDLKSSIKKVQRSISNDDVKSGEDNNQGATGGGQGSGS